MDRLKTNRIGNMDDGQAENNPPIFGSVASCESSPRYLVPVVRRRKIQVLSLSKLPVVVLDLGNIF